MIRDYTMVIPAGGQVTRQVSGSYMALLRSDVDGQIVRVQAIGENGQTVADMGLYQGDKIENTGRPFHQLIFSNQGELAVTVTIVAGDGQYRSDRLSGMVSVEGVVAVREIQNNVNTFSAVVDSYSGATTYGYFELLNPVGSGVIIRLVDLFLYRGGGAVDIRKVINPVSPVPAYAIEIPVAGVGPSKGLVESVTGRPSDYIVEYAADNCYIGTAGTMVPDAEVTRAQRGVQLSEGESIVFHGRSVAMSMTATCVWEESYV